MFKSILIAGIMLFAGSANAAMALALSESAPSNKNYATATSEADTGAAVDKALAECAKATGRKDCEIVLSSNKPGYGAMYGTCISATDCFYSFAAGFPTLNAAHDSVLASCKKTYGVNSCFPFGDWQDTGSSSAAKASPPAAVQLPPGRYPPETDMKSSQAPVKPPRSPQPSQDSVSQAPIKSAVPLSSDQNRDIAQLEKACEKNQVNSCLKLGVKFQDGDEVKQDLKKALSLFQKACDLNDEYGCTTSGEFYEKGKGVSNDLRKAIVFFEKGCRLKDDLACEKLSDSYWELAMDKPFAVCDTNKWQALFTNTITLREYVKQEVKSFQPLTQTPGAFLITLKTNGVKVIVTSNPSTCEKVFAWVKQSSK